MTAIDNVLEANRKYADSFTEGGLPGLPPSRRLAVVACMDSRIDVSRMLGLELGAAHVIRNAGGIVTEDVLRSLIISHHLGGTEEFMIVNHTKCALLGCSDDVLVARVRRATGKQAEAPVRFHGFGDLEENVREQIRRLRSHAWLPETIPVRGFIYDVDTARLLEVLP
jgi:carbonic anhydrase